MTPSHFDFAAPSTVDEVVALLVAHGPRARVLGGGTDLLPRLERGLLAADMLVSLHRIAALRALAFDAREGLAIGAAARLADVAEHADVRANYPALVEAISLMATPQIRNMGTIAGNIGNGSPCADSVPVLIAASASVELVGPHGPRRAALDGLFRGPGVLALEPGELIARVLVPPPPADTGFAFRKLPARTAVDVSAVNVGAMVAADHDCCREARLVLGAVGPTPLRATRAEALLEGRTLDEELLAEAGALAAEDSRPISDVRASASHRRAMVAVLVRRALASAAARAGLHIGTAGGPSQ